MTKEFNTIFSVQWEYKVLIDNVYVPMYEFHSGDASREALMKKLCKCSIVPTNVVKSMTSLKMEEFKCSFLITADIGTFPIYVVPITPNITVSMVQDGCMIMDFGIKGFGVCLLPNDIRAILLASLIKKKWTCVLCVFHNKWCMNWILFSVVYSSRTLCATKASLFVFIGQGH